MLLPFKWVGLSFNNCEIIKPIDLSKIKGKDFYECKCYCGKAFNVRPYDLSYNRVKSCGCLKRKIVSDLGKSFRKYNYYNFINEQTKAQILRPVDPLKENNIDEWICLCPYHDPPVEFINIPSSIISGVTKSCGCLAPKKASERFILFNKQQKLNRHLFKNKCISKNILIRNLIYNPIKHLIYKLHKTCALCNINKTANIHHIIPLHTIDHNDITTYLIAYDINNLIGLCKDCHWLAHDYDVYCIDKPIQKELQNLVKSRKVSNKLMLEYNNIIEIRIKPYLNKLI
jgi:hypothetical protein